MHFRLAAAALALSCVTSCITSAPSRPAAVSPPPQPSQPAEPVYAPRPAPVTPPAPSAQLSRSGFTWQQVEEASLRLRPGLTEGQVLELLGLPTTTSVSTYGTKTPRPWAGIEWQYKWVTPYKRLCLVFASGSAGSYLNHWNWY